MRGIMAYVLPDTKNVELLSWAIWIGKKVGAPVQCLHPWSSASASLTSNR